MKLGLQLYTVRDQLEKDLDGTLSALSSYGLKYVETAGTYGLSPEAFREKLEKHGLTATSMHTGINLDVADYGVPALAKEARALGVKYVVLPWSDKKRWDNKWSELAAKFAYIGARLADEGLVFGYHNHDFEFRPDTRGNFPADEFRNHVPADKMVFEIDLYWAAFAGHDPAAVVAKYGKRCVLAHLKDGKLGGAARHEAAGEGDMRWAPILQALKNAGTEYGFIELDSYSGNMMEAVRKCIEYFTAKA